MLGLFLLDFAALNDFFSQHFLHVPVFIPDFAISCKIDFCKLSYSLMFCASFLVQVVLVKKSILEEN